MRTVSTAKAPRPLGHYAQAVIHGGTVYVAGQLGIDPKTGLGRTSSIEEEVEQALLNIAAILEAAGSNLQCVLKTTVYLSEVECFAPMNTVYARVFGDHRPARATVPIKDLPKGFRVEIDAIAAVRGKA